MDLKSMLNDSAAQRPPSLHTPHSSYDARTIDKSGQPGSHSRSQSHSQNGRPLPHPPPLQPVDSRGHSTGGYFGTHSPHPNQINSASSHVSTPSVGPHSAYARSPGTQSQSYTPRESAGPSGAYNASFVPSPSLSVNQPPTPGSVYQHQTHTPLSAHSQNNQPLSFSQAQSPRVSHPPNGHARQITPNTPHPYPQPATPLGPPLKISPQIQRPPSQEHYRKSSYGSVGSAHGRDQNPGYQQPPDVVRSESVQRQSIPDLERVKERERSVSVSPKTIPQPSPYRQTSVGSQAGSQGRLSVQSPSETRAMSNISDIQTSGTSGMVEITSEQQKTPNPRSSTLLGEHQGPASRGPSMKRDTSEIASSPAPSQNLKRNASVMSDQIHTPHMPPRKRLKRDEIPIFARSAREKVLRLGTGERAWPKKPAERSSTQAKPPPPPPPSLPQTPQQQPQQIPGPQQQQQQHQSSPPPPLPQSSSTTTTRSGSSTVVNGQNPTSVPMPVAPAEFKWEASIANISPYEDLTRRVCDWIFQEIGTAVPPSGGAMFEIEAKIGAIFDVETGARLWLPVETETVYSRGTWKKTKFESSMNMEQHQLLNKYLNELTREAFLQAQKGERQEILYDHPYEVDEFFELTPEGRQNLNPSIVEYLNRRKEPRVRRTRDQNTGQIKAQIIKSRIADMEIFNPNTDFDCRISISIESPWEGNPDWLIPVGDGSEGRRKDRMSYRHMAYQVDLTQVSHSNQDHQEHELEVEISTEQIRREIDNLQNGRPSKYEDLVRGLLDNVRLLCRKGSVGGPRRL